MSRLFVNGKIFTAQAERDDFAEALVVDSQGKIAYVGDATTAKERCGNEAASTVDLGGKVVLPGFIDAHSHLGMLGSSVLKADLTHAKSLADIERILVEARRQEPEADRLLGRSWRFDSLVDADGKQVRPHREILDRMLPGVPVYLDAFDLHSTWCSSAALAEMGVTEATPDPKGGKVERDPKGGMSGLLLENAAVELVWAFLAEHQTKEQRIAALDAAFAAYLATGVTGAIDMAMNETDLEALEEYYTTHGNKLPLRVAAHWLVLPAGTEQDCVDRVTVAEKHKARLASMAPYLRVVGIKVIVDGVIDACTAHVKEAYADGTRADPIWTYDELLPVVRAADKAGLQVACHAIGNGAVSIALDVLEKTFEENGLRSDRRHRIEHMECIDADDIKRLARLQLTASLQPVHADPAIAPNWHAMLGYDERTHRSFPWDEFRAAGCRIALGTDAPTAPHESLPNMYVATTRRSALEPDMPWPPKLAQLAKYDHTVFTLRDALIGATSGAAHSCHAEREVGVLAPGLSADFAVLSIDPFKQGLEVLARAHDAISQTWVAGEKTCYVLLTDVLPSVGQARVTPFGGSGVAGLRTQTENDPQLGYYCDNVVACLKVLAACTMARRHSGCDPHSRAGRRTRLETHQYPYRAYGRHSGTRAGTAELIVTFSNYKYALYWIFDTAANLHYEICATGIMSVTP